MDLTGPVSCLLLSWKESDSGERPERSVFREGRKGRQGKKL